MTLPIAITLASLAFVAALCRGIPTPVTGPTSTNWMLRITMRDLAFFGGSAVVRAAVYAQEKIEQVIKWLALLVNGNATMWAALVAIGDTGLAVALGIAAAVLTWGTQSLAPIRRRREYAGHAAELLQVTRYAPELIDYRANEVGMMLAGYDGLFAGHDVDAGLTRWEPVAQLMLHLIAPALRRFASTEGVAGQLSYPIADGSA